MDRNRDNYKLQALQAKQRFLTYDQQELIRRCRLRYDENYLYVCFLAEDYRICRKTGNMERLHRGSWIDGNSFAEVMTLLDWLCDSRPDRSVTGRWVNIVTQGHYFHRNLQEEGADPDAALFCARQQAYEAACRKLGGKPMAGADVGYAIEVLDGVSVFLKLWHPDEEFPAQLVVLWEENVLQYIRYETTWYLLGLIRARIKAFME